MTADVPPSRLRRELVGPEARREYIRPIPPDPIASCQICSARAPELVLEPVVDRTNGQRITVAICAVCVEYAGKAKDHTIPPASRRKEPR